MPNDFSMLGSILNWNEHITSHIKALFEFALAYLVDNTNMPIPKILSCERESNDLC